jgi:hypothetical protein
VGRPSQPALEKEVKLSVVGGAVVAAVVGLILATALGAFGGRSDSGAAAARPLAVSVSLEPSAVFFGDSVVATVAVDLDRRTVSPKGLRIKTSFVPYTQTSLPEVRHSSAGSVESIVYRFDLQCLSDDCLPTTGSKLIRFRPVTVTAQTDGKPLHTTDGWPALTVASRLTAADVASATPKFRVPATPPAARFGAPAALVEVLAAAAVVLALGALAIVAGELRPLARRRRLAALQRRTPLETAIAYARQAAARPDPADRRKALALLARALAGSGARELAMAAGDAAWSEAPPTPDRTLEVAEDAEPNGGAS